MLCHPVHGFGARYDAAVPGMKGLAKGTSYVVEGVGRRSDYENPIRNSEFGLPGNFVIRPNPDTYDRSSDTVRVRRTHAPIPFNGCFRVSSFHSFLHSSRYGGGNVIVHRIRKYFGTNRVIKPARNRVTQIAWTTQILLHVKCQESRGNKKFLLESHNICCSLNSGRLAKTCFPRES